MKLSIRFPINQGMSHNIPAEGYEIRAVKNAVMLVPLNPKNEKLSADGRIKIIKYSFADISLPMRKVGVPGIYASEWKIDNQAQIVCGADGARLSPFYIPSVPYKGRTAHFWLAGRLNVIQADDLGDTRIIEVTAEYRPDDAYGALSMSTIAIVRKDNPVPDALEQFEEGVTMVRLKAECEQNEPTYYVFRQKPALVSSGGLEASTRDKGHKER